MKPAINPSQEEGRLYSQKDAKTILEQAIGADDNSFTDENLGEIAKELGISPTQLEAAKELLFNKQQNLIELEELKNQRWKITMTALVLVAGMGLIAIIAYLSYETDVETFKDIVFYVFFIVIFTIGYYFSKQASK